MGWYERHVFNRAMEHVLDRPVVWAERAAALEAARGRILDVGLGTGMNLPSYPAHVERITTVSPGPRLDARALARAAARGIDVAFVEGHAEAMPVPSAAFDTVVCTFVLCTVADPAAALAEFRRVLAPGGRLVFLEHVASPRPAPRALQRVLDPVHRRLACGCSIVRDTVASIRRAGFHMEALTERHVGAVPWPYRRVIRGAASSTRA
ncbi:MAG: class I SAM-dependent methyltransferase [Myxococcales bacterium]|nr:class I SAM-dependent methyltransferase [Myxococcales bacterium]